MTLIRLSGFGGENRALHPTLLPESVGVSSLNQKPGRGDLRPWKAPLTVATVPGGRKTIYRMGRDVAQDANYWLSWPSVVHAVRGPNAADNAERTYYTGDGTPKWTDTSKALASLPYPTSAMELGIPAPASPCTLSSVSAYTPATTDSSSKTTATIEIALGKVKVTTSSPHGFSVGKVASVSLTWTASGVSHNNGGGGVVTSPIAVSNTITGEFPITAVTSSSFSFVNPEYWDVPAGSSAPGTATITIDVAAVEPETEVRFYTYTYVTTSGEEGAPNAAPATITCDVGASVTISSLVPPPAGNYGINRIRVYRTQAGASGGADFYFLREIASTLTSTTDDHRELGEVMPSTTWLQPPADLTWLTGMWNGMMAGISGRSVRFCEAYQPYAWPLAYEVLPTSVTPVALRTFGQTLVILTNGSPIVVTGGSPDAMDEQPVEFSQACIAPLSAVDMGFGVAWASPDGLAFLGQGGARMLTEGVMTRDDWQAINPISIQGCVYERRYFGFYTQSGVNKAFMLDPANPQGIYFLDFGADALYLDDLQDALYVLNGTSVQKWDAGTLKSATFKSRLNKLPRPMIGFACAEVVADSYPVTFKLYADDVLKHTQTVLTNNPFRLPGGYYCQTVQTEVSTTGAAIQSVTLAHSMQEIAQA